MARPQINWLAPDYTETFKYRTKALALLRTNAGALAQVREWYSHHWADFIQDWMLTYDPRKINTSESTIVPFVLFPRQVEFVEWVYARWRARERGLGEKSRDVGFSWLACACAVCIWLFYENANIGFGSRKKESVDNGDDDPDSLFWKIRFLISNLPTIFIPDGYPSGNKAMLVVNPETRSTIKGEIGDAIGMGGRTSLTVVDEADALEHPMSAEAALSATTDCRIDISTANNVGSVFYNNRRSLPEHQIFTFDWTDDPRKRRNPHLSPDEEPWYQQQKRELDPSVVASQIDRNPNAALANTFINSELIDSAFNRLLSQVEVLPQVPWSLGIDASGMGNNESILWRRRGRINLPILSLGNLDGIQLAMRVEQEARELLKLGPLALICVERDGPGGSCADQLAYGPFASVLCAIHTGAKLKDGKHYNLRAWLHNQAKEYLKEQDPYIPRDPTFLAQATAILHYHKGGTLLIESKDDYRGRLSGVTSRVGKMAGRSPDRWDAFVLSFMLPMGAPIRRLAPEIQAQAPAWRPLDAVLGY